MYNKWNEVDWSRRNSEIVKQTGLSPAAVSRKRKSIGVPHPGRPTWRINWSGTNWSKSDAELALEKNCSVTAVAYARSRQSWLSLGFMSLILLFKGKAKA